MAAAASRGVIVCNVPDYGTTEIADHVMAMVLALKRGVILHHDAQRRQLRPEPALPGARGEQRDAARIAVEALRPERFDRSRLPADVPVLARDRFESAQTELAETNGVSKSAKPGSATSFAEICGAPPISGPTLSSAAAWLQHRARLMGPQP